MKITKLLFTIDKALEFPVTIEATLEAGDDPKELIMQLEDLLRLYVNKYRGIKE